MSSSQVRPLSELSAVKVTVVVPAAPETVLTVSQLGATATVVSLPAIHVCSTKAHSPEAVTVISLEPPSWLMPT